METDWVESGTDVPQDSIRAFLKKHLNMIYSSPVRDRFRVRLVRTADNESTEVYLTHSGIEEVAIGGNLASASNAFIWQQRPSDPELETEMLNRLMLYLGDLEKNAGSKIAVNSGIGTGSTLARLIERDGESQLIISEGYSNAWQLVGIALDKNNYSIDDQDRTHGLYIVEYRDLEKENKKHRRDDSWLDNLLYWSRETEDQPSVQQHYWVRLSDRNDHTIVVVRNSGDKPDISAGARQVLESLQRTLN
jgi:outer membrane protein assembly factor BamC